MDYANENGSACDFEPVGPPFRVLGPWPNRGNWSTLHPRAQVHARKVGPMAEHTLTTPEERAARRLKNINGFRWHGATYLIVTTFLWFVDILNGSLDFAYWVSISWGIGLAFHLAAILIGEDDESSPRYRRLLEQERHSQQL